MDVQDARDSRRELQAIHEAISQQNLIMQRLERNLRRLEDSYGKAESRLDALERSRADHRPEKVQLSEGQTSEQPAGPGERRSRPTSAVSDGGVPSLGTRAKSTIRGAIVDGSINTTLDKLQASLKLADDAAGSLSQIASLVRSSLDEGGAGFIQGEGIPIPGGSLALLLELAKTPQFQRFIAKIVAETLRNSDAAQPSSSPGHQEG